MHLELILKPTHFHLTYFMTDSLPYILFAASWQTAPYITILWFHLHLNPVEVIKKDLQ